MFKNKLGSALWLLWFVIAKKMLLFFQDTIDSAQTKTERKCHNQD